MPNPLFNEMGGMRMPGPMGNMQQLMAQFQQFKSQFRGDPQAEVQKLLQSGRMSQQQLNQLQQMASQMQQMFGGFM